MHRRIGRRDDRAVARPQGRRCDAQPLRRDADQREPRLRRRLSNRRRADHERLASRRVTLIGRPVGVALEHLGRRERDVQLVGDELRDRGLDPGPLLDLPPGDGDLPVAIDRDPRIDVRIRGIADGGCRRHPLSDRVQRCGTDRNDERADAGQEIDAGQSCRAHEVLPATAWTRRTRTWTLQRHRLPSSAVRICASVGCGCCSSNAAADIVMPGMQ